MEQFTVVLLAVFVLDAEADTVCDEKERTVRLFDFRKIISVFSAGFLELSQEFSSYADGTDIPETLRYVGRCAA